MLSTRGRSSCGRWVKIEPMDGKSQALPPPSQRPPTWTRFQGHLCQRRDYLCRRAHHWRCPDFSCWCETKPWNHASRNHATGGINSAKPQFWTSLANGTELAADVWPMAKTISTIHHICKTKNTTKKIALGTIGQKKNWPEWPKWQMKMFLCNLLRQNEILRKRLWSSAPAHAGH